MRNSIQLGNRTISDNSPCFIIAELSCNHQQNFDLAVQTIQEMKKAGADCVKLQTVDPGSITIRTDKKDFVVGGGTLWDGKTLFDLYSEVYTPWEWHEPLKKMTEDLGMVFFSSPFDPKAVDFLASLDVPAYKIASFEITDIPLIRHTAAKGKPVIISTGIAREEDIDDAVAACLAVGNDQVILLKCTSAYPTPLEEVNLKAIKTLRDKYNCLIGLSDHTIGSLIPVGAVALGARVVEKHFILDRALGGPDAAFSMEPAEFKEMVDNIRKLESALGVAQIQVSERVAKSRQFARSLYVVQDMKAGESFTEQNVRSIRPGHGMKPKFLPAILGKTAATDIEKGTPLADNLIR